jgi:hypothetical protein
MRLLIDANVHHHVGQILLSANHDVEYVTSSFLDGTPDEEIEIWARTYGWIIVSHDRQFLRRIAQARFDFDDTAGSGFGRIMLMTSVSSQLTRVSECLPVLELLHDEAVRVGNRYLVTIGERFIRYDDKSALPHS